MKSQDPKPGLMALNPLAEAFKPTAKDYHLSIEIKSLGEAVPRVVGRSQTGLSAIANLRADRIQHISDRISILPADRLPPGIMGKVGEGAELFGGDIAKFPLMSPQKSDAPIAGSMALTEFHPFPRLPSELRLKIWKLNMPGPRVVELRYSKKIYHAISPTSTPALLHVCREARAEAMKHYTLLFNPHYLTPRVFINSQIDTLYFSEKRGGEFNAVFDVKEAPYFDYFKIMTKNIHPAVFTDLRRIAINDAAYLGNIEWDDEREDIFNLTKFTNLDIAAMIPDPGNKINGPVKLVQVTWGACPVHTEIGRTQPFYDGDEVLHSCNLCGCPFIKELREALEVDHIYFEQLERGLRAMFFNFKEKKLSWKVPRTKTMALAAKNRDVKPGQFEFHFLVTAKPVTDERRAPANVHRPASRGAGPRMQFNQRLSF